MAEFENYNTVEQPETQQINDIDANGGGGGGEKKLSEGDRKRLDGIVIQMQNNKENDNAIKAVVSDFVNKYGEVPTQKQQLTQQNIDAVKNYLSQKTPEQKQEKQRQLQEAVKQQKPITQVKTTVPKAQIPKPVSEEDVTKEAIRRFNSPIEIYKEEKKSQQLPSAMEGEDPLGDIINNIQSKQKELLQSTKDPLNDEVGSELAVGDKQIQLLKENAFKNGEEAGNVLSNQMSKELGAKIPLNLDQVPISEIQQFNPKTITGQIAKEKYLSERKVKDVISSSPDLEKAAIKYAVNYGDENTSKQLKYLLGQGEGSMLSIPSVVRGNILLSLLNNRDLNNIANQNPELKQKIKEEIFNFPVNYPEAATKLLIEKLADERDRKGLNNYFANIQSTETTDKLFNDLVKNGQIPESYRKLYEKNIRPNTGQWATVMGRNPIPTGGFFERMNQGMGNIFTDPGKALANVPLPFTNVSLRNIYKSSPEQTYEAIEKEAGTPYFEPHTSAAKFWAQSGDMAGMVVPIIAGGELLGASGLVKNPEVANQLMFAAQGLGDYSDRAKTLFPGEPAKQYTYTGIMTLLNAWGAKLLPGTKIGRILSDAEPEINNLVSKVSENKITTEQAKKSILNTFVNRVKDIGASSVKSGLNAGEFMAASTAIDKGLSQLLQGKYPDVRQTGHEVWDAFKNGFLSSIIIGGIEGSISKNKGIKEIIYDMASNPERAIEAIEKSSSTDPDFHQQKGDMVNNLIFVSDLKRELDGQRNLTEEQKRDYITNSLLQKIQEDKLRNIQQPALKIPIEQKIKQYQQQNEEIINQKPEETQGGLNDAEQKAIDVLSKKDLSKTPYWYLEKTLKDETSSPAEKREALKEIYDQLTAKGTEAEAGQYLGKDADLIYDLNYQKPVESAGVKEITSPKEIKQDLDVYNELLNKTERNPEEEKQLTDTKEKIITSLTEQLRELNKGSISKLIDDYDLNTDIPLETLGIKTNDNLPTIIDKLSKYDGEFQPFFEAIKKLGGGEDVKIREQTSEDVKKYGSFQGGYIREADNPTAPIEDKKTLIINPTTKNQYYTLAHEIGHWLTLDSGAIDKYGNKKLLGTLSDIFNVLKSNKEYAATSERYGLKDFKEFMAELLINPTFRKEMSDIVMTNKEFEQAVKRTGVSVQKSFVDLVREFFSDIWNKLLGKSEAPKPIIDKAVDAAQKLFFGGEDVVSGQRLPETKTEYLEQPHEMAALPEISKLPKSKDLIDKWVEENIRNGVPKEIIDEALQRAGLKETETKKLVSVIKPSEIKKPQTVTIKTKEHEKQKTNVKDQEDETKRGERDTSAGEGGKPGLPEIGGEVRGGETQREGIQKEKIEEYAIQEQSPSGVLQYPQEGIGETGGERGGMEPSKQGVEIAEKGKVESKEEKVKPFVQYPPTSLSYAGTERSASEFGLEERIPTERKRDIYTIKEADELLKKGWDAREELAKIDRGEKNFISDAEYINFTRYAAELEGRLREMKGDINSPEYDKTLKELKRIDDAANLAGKETGRSLSIRGRYKTVPDGTYGNYMLLELASNNDAPLTPKQKEVANEQWEQLNSANKNYEKVISELEEKVAKLESEKKLNEIKKTGKKSPKSHQEFVKDRQSIIEEAKRKIKEAREKASSPDAPKLMGVGGRTKIDDLITIAPEVTKLVKSYVEEGITKLDEIVKKAFDEFSGIVDDLKEKDIHDIIAGVYNERKGITKKEANIELENLRVRAKLLNKLDALLKGEEPKTEKSRIKRNQEIEKFKKEIGIDKLEQLSALIKRNQTETEKIKAKIEKGDFEPEQKRKPLLSDAEIKKVAPDLYEKAIKSQDELIKAKREIAIRRAKQMYEQKSPTEKTIEVFSKSINIPRAIMASLDYSAPLRQAIIATIAHPKISSEALKFMFEASANEKIYNRWLDDVHKSPRWDIAEKTKLSITDPESLHVKEMEEAFQGAPYAEKIPIAGEGIRASERAYVGYLNKIRWDLFNMYADRFEEMGKTFDNNPELYKGLSSFINSATGRGGMKGLESASPILNWFLFASKLISSRLNMLGLSDVPNLAVRGATFGRYGIDYGFYTKLPKEVRIEAAKDMLKFVAVGISTLLLIKSLSNLTDGNIEVETDPRSSDFGKIKSGNTRWDIWGGFQPYARVATQVVLGQRKTTTTREIQELDGKGAFGQTRLTPLATFARGKLAPVPATIINLSSGRDAGGQPIDFKKEGLKLITPLIVNDLIQGVKDQGVKALFTVGVPSAFGVGVQTFTPKPPKKKSKTGRKFQSKSHKK